MFGQVKRSIATAHTPGTSVRRTRGGATTAATAATSLQFVSVIKSNYLIIQSFRRPKSGHEVSEEV